jgi:hypothetical protein
LGAKLVKGKDVSIEGKYDSKEFYIERVNFLLMNLDIYIQDWEKESK